MSYPESGMGGLSGAKSNLAPTPQAVGFGLVAPLVDEVMSLLQRVNNLHSRLVGDDPEKAGLVSHSNSNFGGIVGEAEIKINILLQRISEVHGQLTAIERAVGL